MDQMTPFLLCLGIAGIVVAINYILVTRQEQREGKPPAWNPDQIDWDAATDWRIRADIGRGNKIEAIKRYQELTGAGLKESKDVIEYLAKNPDVWEEKKKAPRPELDDAPGIRDLLEEGRDDEAVEVYRKFAGVDGYTARAAVEQIKREMKG